jgi:outer membrane protein TolC
MMIAVVTPAFSTAINLEQAIRLTCQNSDSSRMMKETLIKSQLMIREQRAAAFPAVSGAMALARQYSPAILPSMPQPEGSGSPYYDWSFSVSQPIVTFGKIGNGIRAAAQFDSSVNRSHARNMQQLQLAAMDAYFMVALARMKLDVTSRSLERKRQLHDFLQRNFDLGSGSKAQLLATRADLKSQQTEIIQDARNYQTARMLLCSYMGIPLSDSLEIDTAFSPAANFALPLPGSAQAVQSAMDGRSDLASIEWLIKVNMTGSSICRSMYLPNVIGRASYGATGNDPADMADFDSRNWLIGVGLQWRIFDGLSNSIKAEQYRSDARKLEAARDAVKKMIEIEVVSALAECAAADSNRIASTEILAAAREGYELTNTNFKGGSGLFVEVQDADERLMLAEIGDVQARCRFIRSRAVLQVAMGKDILTKEEI